MTRVITELWLAASSSVPPSPIPSLKPGISPTDISPGLLGFLATAGLVAMVIPLAISLNRHLRRAKFKQATAAAEMAPESEPKPRP